MPDGTEATTTDTTTATAGTDTAGNDAAYYRAEAQKAFKARDDLKAKLRDFEGRVLSDEDRDLFATLKDQQAKAEEDRAKKAGEWEALKQQNKERFDAQNQAHLKALADKDAAIQSERTKRVNRSIAAAFGAATDYFNGSDASKTILDVDLAISAFGKYVSVEDDETDPTGERIVVKKPNGDTIFGADGNPAPFSDAIGELIKSLPNKDRILRGSGKTGSGSSGGSTHAATTADVTELTQRARNGDKAAIEALRRRRSNSGGMVMGEAFTR